MEAHVVALLAPKSVEIAGWFLPRKSAAGTHTIHDTDDKQAKTYEHLLLRLCFASVLPAQIEDPAQQCNAMGKTQIA